MGAEAPPPVITPSPTVVVHLNAPLGYMLQRRTTDAAMPWVDACGSPCDLPMRVDDVYRVTGKGITSPKELRLTVPPSGTFFIDVSPASIDGQLFGGMLLGTGAIAICAGFIALTVGFGSGDRGPDGPTIVGGLIAMGAGALGVVGGGLLLASSKETEVSVGDRARPEDPSPPAPVWRSNTESAALPKTQLPFLFSHTF